LGVGEIGKVRQIGVGVARNCIPGKVSFGVLCCEVFVENIRSSLLAPVSCYLGFGFGCRSPELHSWKIGSGCWEVGVLGENALFSLPTPVFAEKICCLASEIWLLIEVRVPSREFRMEKEVNL
jgi:hypothetical protein